MERFTVKLAGVAIGVTCQYISTKEYCRDYLTDSSPDFSVIIRAEDVDAEKQYFEEQPNLRYLETLALYRKISEGLAAYGVFLMHGSAIAVDGEVYIFVAPSGTGKSTHSALWRKYLVPHGHKVVMVNDDKPLIKISSGQILACGTPWNGAHRLSENVELPVKAICAIERSENVSIDGMSAADAFSTLFRFAYRPRDAAGLSAVLGLLEEVLRKVRFYRLKCNISEEAAETAYNTMK